MSLPNLAPIPELYVSYDSAQKLKHEAGSLPSWDLTQRQICDLELLMNGGFYPLKGFMTEADYDGVVADMRLADGSLWPIPVNLDVTEGFADTVEPGQDIALRDAEGVILAIMSVTDKWQPDKSREAKGVFGADDLAHPSVNYLHHTAGRVYLGGPITGIQPPVHYDFKARRDTPNELRAFFRKLGWRKVVAFQTRNPLHRAHQELTFRAAREAQANLLIHPVVGMTKPGDVDHFTRVRCYEAVLDKYPASTTHLSLLNLAMRMGGPREALWHAIIRRNHGITHMIIGRDHAGVGDYYGAFDAQTIFDEEVPAGALTIQIFRADHTAYSKKLHRVVMMRDAPDHTPEDFVQPSGTKVREMLAAGQDLPIEFARPEIAKILMGYYQSEARK